MLCRDLTLTVHVPLIVCVCVCVTHLLMNVSPDSDPRQIVRRGHGGQYQGGSETFRFFQVSEKKAPIESQKRVQNGSPSVLLLSLKARF